MLQMEVDYGLLLERELTERDSRKVFPCVLKGYFDGSFAMFRRFPSDASMYLFLWDPQSSGEKGIDIPMK